MNCTGTSRRRRRSGFEPPDMKLDVILRLIVAVPVIGLCLAVIGGLTAAVGHIWMALIFFLPFFPVFMLAILWIEGGNKLARESASGFIEDFRFRFRRMKQNVSIQHPGFGLLAARENRWIGKVDSAIMGTDTTICFSTQSGWIGSADDSPSEEQFDGLRQFLLNEESSRNSIAQAIYRVYCEYRDTALEYESTGGAVVEEFSPSIDSMADVWEHLMSGNIEIPPQNYSTDTGVLLWLNWFTDWDIEHGLHVSIGQNNVVIEAYME